ncbi:MAG TPA: ATP-binding protein [Propionibacteriaceae bacterium]|nr:ATP-binding protein [Propionibacteriaceae bacterium]
MSPVGVAVVALVVGLCVGGLLMWISLRLRRRDPASASDPAEPVVPDGVAEVLAVLNSTGVVVGSQDQVLQATVAARTLGLVRGSRIVEPQLLDLVRAVRRERGVVTTELQVTIRAGAPVSYFSVRVAPLGEDLILVLADDQTGARRTEQIRRDFMANVSHELKTPIGAISLLAEAVEEAADDPVAVRRFANRMGVESARLTDLVAQIIDLSRLQGDNPLADPEVVDVDAVLSEAVDRRRVDAEQRRVTLTIAGTSGSKVLGSARQLGVAVGNLVENAVVYSDPGARVVVASVERTGEDDLVEIRVSDNGIGIPAAELERIFERFYRVDYARSRANGGTGLGLSIVKHIAAIHGGDVTVWSQVGRGSTFTIKLPAHLPVPAPVRPAVEEQHRLNPEPQEVKR